MTPLRFLCLESRILSVKASHLLPITPVFGKAETADFGTADLGTCNGHSGRFFATGLECPAGSANTDAELLGDDPSRGAGGSQLAN